jgi:hypothetical protein
MSEHAKARPSKEVEMEQLSSDEDDVIIWDEHHSSPRAEVVLVSKDKVGFRVDAWFMKRKRLAASRLMCVLLPSMILISSDFIKSLLDVPSTQALEEAPIHLNQTADIVRVFVDYIISSKGFEIKSSVKDCQHLIDLCDHLQVPVLHAAIIQSLKFRASRKQPPKGFDAWGMFKIAADQDDLNLAKFAVGCFDRADVSIRDIFAQDPPSLYDGIPPRYIYALLQCFAKPTSTELCQDGTPLRGILFRSESEAARAFSLT